MKVLKVLLNIAAVCCLIVLGFVAYTAGFSKAEPELTEHNPIYIAYKIYSGNYFYSSEFKVNEIKKFILNDLKAAETGPLIAVRLDYEQGKSSDKYAIREDGRALAGYLITKEQYESFPSDNDKGVKKARIPSFNAVSVTMPYKGFLTRPLISYKTISALPEYIKSKHLRTNTIIEIYDSKKDTADFYVIQDFNYEVLLKIFGL